MITDFVLMQATQCLENLRLWKQMELNWRWLLQEMHIFLSKTKIWKPRAISGANCALERNVSFLFLSVSPHRSENFLHKTK